MAKKKKEEESTKNALEIALDTIRKTHGKGAIMMGNSGGLPRTSFKSSGCLSLDKALGGGWGRGRVIEIFGPESSGKTTLTLHAIAAAQKRGEVCAFIDVEHALDPDYAADVGVNLDTLLISQPDSGEEALQIAESLMLSGMVGIIVLDSVAALVPRFEIDKEIGDSTMGRQAGLMSQAMRKLTPKLAKTGTTMFFINQIRMKIGVVFGNPETTSGGNALKFYASQRVDVRRTGSIKDGTDIIANETRAKIIKNKLYPPFKQALFQIRFGVGIDLHLDVFRQAIEEDLITKTGHSYFKGDFKLGVGEPKAVQCLRDNPELYQELYKKLIEDEPETNTETEK